MTDKIQTTHSGNNLEAGQSGSCVSGLEAGKQKNEVQMKYRDRRSETLSRIAAYLETYTASDELDEDSILSITSKLDESRSLRYRMKNLIYAKTQSVITSINTVENSVSHEDISSNKEELEYKSTKSTIRSAYESHIDGDFFFDIIDDIERGSDDFLLDDDTISSLRQSLLIAPQSKKRKRRDLKLTISPDSEFSHLNESFESNSISSRPKRGAIRGCEYGSHSEEYDDIYHLLSAMIESEKKNGRSVDLINDIRQELSLTRRLRKRKKKNTEFEMRDPDSIKGSNDEKESTSSPKKKGRITKKQDRNRIRSSTNKLKKNNVLNRNISLKNNEAGSINQNSSKKNNFGIDGNENPILEWRLLENRWNLNHLSLEPKRTRHQDSIYGNFSCNLLNSLKGKSRVFARYEFFYSDIDKSWFNENLFHKELISLGISPTARFTRKEWSTIRRKITKQTPRRFSRKFIDSSFERLNQYRRKVRAIQKCHFMGEPIHMEHNFEYEVLAPPKVGSIVTAYCHKVHLLHRGTILSHDYSTGSYLIQFEKKSLGHAWCPDFEVSSHGLQEVIFTGSQKYLQVEDTHSSYITHYGSLPQGTSFGFIADSIIRMPAVGNVLEKVEKYQKNFTPLSLRQHRGIIKEISDELYECHSLALIMSLIDSLMERKEVLLKSIDCTNVEASKGIRSNIDEEHPVVCQHFDWLIKNLEVTENALQAALIHLKIVYGAAFDKQKCIPDFKHAIESFTLELCNEVQWRLSKNETDNQIMGHAAGLLAVFSMLSDTVDEGFILNNLQETLNFQLEPLRPITSCREDFPRMIQESVRLQNESFKFFNNSVEMFLTELTKP